MKKIDKKKTLKYIREEISYILCSRHSNEFISNFEDFSSVNLKKWKIEIWIEKVDISPVVWENIILINEDSHYWSIGDIFYEKN